MNASRALLHFSLVLAAIVWLTTQAYAQLPSLNSLPQRDLWTRVNQKRAMRVSQADREAAAERLKAARTAVRAKAQQSAKTAGIYGTGEQAMAMHHPMPGGIPDYFGSANWAYSPELRKFVDRLPGLGPTGANNLGQYIPIANPDKITYPGSDYYEIEVRQYTEKMHSDLPPTTLRGYVQTNKGTDANGNNTLAPAPIHYLGPLIIAEKDRPVRIKFTNKLPTGSAGDLFIPVDTTVMGAGMGPLGMDAMPMNYTQNRAVIHLHGGRNPWISDGTPHQWIIPAGEMTPYDKGVSVQNVPDMPNPGPGSQTYFFTNQQSSRLMFYHDHSWGITRLNVYVGEAAGYIIDDPLNRDLVNRNIIPADTIPLIIQDKTFVDAATVRTTDPTWNWGTGTPDAQGIRPPVTGDLWYPHVYSPAQNPADRSGMNAYGRWHYGPWFWPPTTGIPYGPIDNPYYDPVNAPWEPAKMPGVPNVSMPGESFMDTPLVNGTAFPTVTVQPKAYRLRILNAANDRFFNLQMYVADPATLSSDGRKDTEVKMVPAVATEGFPETWPTDGREEGVPDPATAGPEWIQIGTEGGFLPAPVVIPQQPVTWNSDPTTFNMGNVQDHSLLIGCAERADVIVDFSQYAGKTLILYNDAPAAFPARDPRLDYYTGSPDLTDTGGYWGTRVGFGPNTRTIMQIKVANAAPAAPFDLTALEAEFASTADHEGVFQRAHDEDIIVGQEGYDSAYNMTFPNTDPDWGYAHIFDFSLRFMTPSGQMAILPFENKAIQDEMGEAFDEYGRMSGRLGLELPNTQAGRQTFVLQNYIDPATEIVTPLSGPLADGSQIWKITHNGVDTHPIHFHLFDVQVLNRVGWDGAIRPPDPNELGFKETVRVSPLEDTIVALRPVTPRAPFGQPDSVRPYNPSMPLGSTEMFSNFDPYTGDALVPPTTNQIVNFRHEYVWHCHILSHEEMDMMRPIIFEFDNQLPIVTNLNATRVSNGISLTWTDTTPPNLALTWGNPRNEIGFRLERAQLSSNGQPQAYYELFKTLANKTSYVDTRIDPEVNYSYRVVAFNAAGETMSNAVKVFTNLAVFKPDAKIRLSSENNYLGDNVYNTTGNSQSKSLVLTTGTVSTFYVQVQNDGNAGDSLSVTGPAGPAGWTIQYLNTQGNDITGQVTSQAGWSTGPLTVASSTWLRVNVQTDASVPEGTTLNVLITATSQADNAKTDVVRADLTTMRAQPDAMIRPSTINDYLGNDIYNTDGANQVVNMATTTSGVTYYVRIQNDGNVSDTFRFKGTSAPNNWTVRYYDANGNQITGQVTNQNGWSTGSIQPGNFTFVRITVQPNAQVPAGALCTLMMTATSGKNPVKKDVVKAVTTR